MMKGNNEYSFINKKGEVIFKAITFTRDEAIHEADIEGIKGDKYIEIKRKKVK